MDKKTVVKLIADAIIRPAYVVPKSCRELLKVSDLEAADRRQKKERQVEKDAQRKQLEEAERFKKYGPPGHPELFPGF